MNKSIRKVAVALMVLLVALFVNLNYVQVVKGNEYRDDPNNRRVLLNEYASPRGPIVVDGSDIAKSKATQDELKYLRVYPDGPLYSSVTGYYSYLYGTSRIEEAEDSVLSGNDNRLFGTRLADILTGRNPRGGSVDLTINKAAQQAAYSAMKDSNGQLRRGAVVAIEPTTGAILAAVSTPSFDPNALSSHNSTAMSHAYACYSDIAYPVQGVTESSSVYRTRTERSIAVQLALREGGTDLLATKHQQDPSAYPLDGWVYSTDASGSSFRSKQSYAEEQFPSFGKTGCGDVPDDPTQMYVKDPTVAGPLHNRAFSERYAPGSTFKLVVAAAALKDGISPDGERLLAPNAYFPDTGATAKACPTSGGADCLENFQGEQCDNGTDATLAFALAKSCNTTFAYLAVERLGGTAIADEAKLFGFDSPTPLTTPLPVAQSTVGSQQDLTENGFLARTAFGQQDVAMTPLQGAMLSAAAANSGLLMKPYLIDREVAPDLKTLDETTPEQISQVLDPSQDLELQKMMEGVVSSPEGTGAPARIDAEGVIVAGKTGTADNGPADHPNPPHAWFTGYASYQGTPRIAVCVIIENGGVQGDETTGGEAAAPVAKSVMEAYLRSQGDIK